VDIWSLIQKGLGSGSSSGGGGGDSGKGSSMGVSWLETFVHAHTTAQSQKTAEAIEK